ncbi:hypothetical protein LZ31DRAFT_576321 [Colletotrichum somersetense]|nr:hypothetical protein LZ31DRAFT_576321 [Colletotrichum somersetense]
MGLRAAFQGLVSKHDEGRFELPAASCRDDNRQLPRAYSDFNTPMAEMGHDLRTGVHLGEARVYKIQTEIRPKVKTVSPPASAARNTTLTDSSMACHPGTNTLYTEKRYNLAEVAARMAFTDRYGNCGTQDRVVSIPPTPPTKAKPVVVVKRKPLPSESKVVQGRRTPSPLRSAATDEPHSDPPSYLTHEGGERSRSAPQKAHTSTSPTLGRDELHRLVTRWASNTASHEPFIEKPLDVISEEVSSTNPASPVCNPTKRRRKGKKSTVATSHLARGSMRSETEHVDAT